MSGRRPFKDLTKNFTRERRQRVEAKKAGLRAEMALRELRESRALTQKDLGEILEVNQPAVAKMEQRADMHVSNLYAYVEAMGGRLKVVAEFPEGEVTITNFSHTSR